MKRFLYNTFIFIIPLFICLILIIYLDFFRVFSSYNEYYKDNFVSLNREYIVTTTFNKYRKEKKFNSFIFGSSRSNAYKLEEWKNHLDTKAIPFHFDAASEVLYGVANKIRYIDELGDKINNALIIIDRSLIKGTSDKNRTGHLTVSPPCISKKSKFSFYLPFIIASLDFQFLLAYFDYSIFKTHRSYMKSYIRQIKYPRIVNPINCDMYYGEDENIRLDSLGYYKNLLDKGIFYNRPAKRIENCKVTTEEKELLLIIKNIFDKHQTKYKIIISPMYDQVPMEEEQLSLLKSIFGEKHIFNFSGKNKFTDSISNYYETSHFRPHVAKELMAITYQN